MWCFGRHSSLQSSLLGLLLFGGIPGGQRYGRQAVNSFTRMFSFGQGDNPVTLPGVLYWCMLAAGTVGPGTVITCARPGVEFGLILWWTLFVASATLNKSSKSFGRGGLQQIFCIIQKKMEQNKSGRQCPIGKSRKVQPSGPSSKKSPWHPR